jgi:hypothetical protein
MFQRVKETKIIAAPLIVLVRPLIIVVFSEESPSATLATDLSIRRDCILETPLPGCSFWQILLELDEGNMPLEAPAYFSFRFLVNVASKIALRTWGGNNISTIKCVILQFLSPD